jgi:hypothetical protein
MIARGMPDPSMKNRRNYYRLLQVQPDAPVEIIRAAHRTLMLKLKHHPDLGGSHMGATELNEALEVLTDPERRASYDKELDLRYTRRAETPDESPPQTTLFCPVCKRRLARRPKPGDRCAGCQSPLQSENSTDHERAYQRALSRTKRDHRVNYYTTWPGKPRLGEMIDFSPQGMRFRCAEKISPGTVLKIETQLCNASGTVTNTSEESAAGQECYAIGVVFLAVNFIAPKGSFVSTSA